MIWMPAKSRDLPRQSRGEYCVICHKQTWGLAMITEDHATWCGMHVIGYRVFCLDCLDEYESIMEKEKS